ncbi:exosortase A [Sphingomonas paeninsulae]|uniref:Exosortase A n=1 Tax=Sphingomonas paeninsulae TaxID=2319844 RepID=A0A494TKC9_SPHPE|nr:exosortase A [Sphingomonas paeninsulae]AYJ87503.1 exosortase A [Sphingomonas paeninsulae]
MTSATITTGTASNRGFWRVPLKTLAVTLAAMLLLFAHDANAMVWQWWNSSTYQHCLFVLPIVAWLIWQRRVEVASVKLGAWLPGLAFLGLAAFGWLIGQAGGASLIRHAALVAMVQATVLTILGPAVTRAILFPLFYLIFLIPFGDAFVPALQNVTASITMALLHLTGVPAHIDGVFITIPNGWFEVAEACSGVKFLVAMVAYGALVAHVCFKSWRRRAAFMMLCIVAPVLANGVRAFATIYAAHLTSVEIATGFDHVVYGWFFFAIVMALVMLAGWKFFDRTLGDPWLAGFRAPDFRARPFLGMALATVGVVLLPLLWNGTVIAAGRAQLPHSIALSQVAGWTIEPRVAGYPWVARFDGADHRLYGRYRDASGQSVDLAIALYGWQNEGREIVGFAQGAVDPDSKWKWTATAAPPPAGKAERLMAPGRLAREALTFYVLGGGSTGSSMTVKLRTLRARLLGGDQGAAVVILSAEDGPGHPARLAIDRFMQAFGPPQAQTARLFAVARSH